MRRASCRRNAGSKHCGVGVGGCGEAYRRIGARWFDSYTGIKTDKRNAQRTPKVTDIVGVQVTTSVRPLVARTAVVVKVHAGSSEHAHMLGGRAGVETAPRRAQKLVAAPHKPDESALEARGRECAHSGSFRRSSMLLRDRRGRSRARQSRRPRQHAHGGSSLRLSSSLRPRALAAPQRRK